jgi:hypothetical protein
MPREMQSKFFVSFGMRSTAVIVVTSRKSRHRDFDDWYVLCVVTE